MEEIIETGAEIPVDPTDGQVVPEVNPDAAPLNPEDLADRNAEQDAQAGGPVTPDFNVPVIDPVIDTVPEDQPVNQGEAAINPDAALEEGQEAMYEHVYKGYNLDDLNAGSNFKDSDYMPTPLSREEIELRELNPQDYPIFGLDHNGNPTRVPQDVVAQHSQEM